MKTAYVIGIGIGAGIAAIAAYTILRTYQDNRRYILPNGYDRRLDTGVCGAAEFAMKGRKSSAGIA